MMIVQKQQSEAPGTRNERKPLGLIERLRLISLIDEGVQSGARDCPAVSDLFSNLWEIINRTIAGSRIDRLAPEETTNGFHILELRTESGESLGYLNMIYLKKPLPCYYLVYVEIDPLFRKQGLGHRILDTFREFLDEKSAVGLLDNIIPPEDPTWGIYLKHAWEPIESVIGDASAGDGEHYMVYIPRPLLKKDLRHPLYRLLHHIRRKRAFIDMRDNEMMVSRAIEEFKEIRRALETYFERELEEGRFTPLMRFMFTRFVTKLIAFRRRMGDLIGYTGGESLDRVVPSPAVSSLPLLSYAPEGLSGNSVAVEEYEPIPGCLPGPLMDQPARFIEALPEYQRPTLKAWLKVRDLRMPLTFTLDHLLDLGFDPTRLKEWDHEGGPYIFERLQARQIPKIRQKRTWMERLTPGLPAIKALGAVLRCNPPLVVLADRGNAYVLRRKISGIHWEEALDQLRANSTLARWNRELHLDRLILRTLQRARELLVEELDKSLLVDPEFISWFVSWDLEKNIPRIGVDASGPCLESIWIA
ncbi:MAG: hypothetical protein JRJ78_04290 [Deltaproteobacteria bacterium]|nr:hypothetical protein [Deltaproteobacteria bacterium]